MISVPILPRPTLAQAAPVLAPALAPLAVFGVPSSVLAALPSLLRTIRVFAS